MRSRLLAAALFGTLLLPPPSVAAPAPGDARAGELVRVEHSMYLPGTVSVAIGQQVTWAFPEITQHTTTSDQGFWDSGAKASGASYARTFTSAGAFPYHCTFHPHMHGVVKVPVKVTAPTEVKRVFRWSTATAGPGTTFDVQVRTGSGAWKSFRTDTTKPRAAFKPADRTVPYKVRARTTRNGTDSGWSKPVRVTFA
jgi:plastocyanin